MGAHIILHQRGEQRLRHAQAHRAGGEIDVLAVLGARRIALRAFVAAEVLELLPALAAEQILDGVIDRARMRLHRHTILRPQHAEIERGHDGGERSRRCLMSADLQAVVAGAQVVGVMDGPAREPQHLLFKLAQETKLVRGRVRRCIFGHRHGLSGVLGTAEYLVRAGAKSERAAAARSNSAAPPGAASRGYGASSTWRQAAGRSAMRGGGRGFGGTGGGLGCSTASVNQ